MAAEVTDLSERPDLASDRSFRVSEGAQIRSRGQEIFLADGTAHRIIFDYEALEWIEEVFGGIDEFFELVNEESGKSTRLRTVRHGVAAGLLHEKPPELSLEEHEATIRGLLDSRQLGAYRLALMLEVGEAFPAPEKSAAPKARGSRGGSHGNGSTSSRRSASAAAMRSSGG